jgi:hypothetical protein
MGTAGRTGGRAAASSENVQAAAAAARDEVEHAAGEALRAEERGVAGELGWMLRLSGTTSRAGRQRTEAGFGAETRGQGLESTEIACSRAKEAAALRNKRRELALGLQAPGGFLWWRLGAWEPSHRRPWLRG